MKFNNAIEGNFEINSKEQAKEIIKEYIAEFKDLKKENGVWGQLVLIFKEHQEVYDIDDVLENLQNDKNNAFDDLMDEVIKKDLLGSIYVHYQNEIDKSVVTCGISYIYLDCYLEGYESEGDEVRYIDENLNSGLKGDPIEVTKFIEYYKGCQYSKKLVKNFNLYMGETDEYSHFPLPMTVDSWGECTLFIYEPKSIEKLFGRKVKNDYLFYVLETGEVIVATALSYGYTVDDEEFVTYCKEKGVKYGDEATFQMGMNFNGKHRFACRSDIDVINLIKLLARSQNNENNDEKIKEDAVSSLLKIKASFDIYGLEKYCEEVCDKYER